MKIHTAFINDFDKGSNILAEKENDRHFMSVLDVRILSNFTIFVSGY